jgi:hypothetical protein
MKLDIDGTMEPGNKEKRNRGNEAKKRIRRNDTTLYSAVKDNSVLSRHGQQAGLAHLVRLSTKGHLAPMDLQYRYGHKLRPLAALMGATNPRALLTICRRQFRLLYAS